MLVCTVCVSAIISPSFRSAGIGAAFGSLPDVEDFVFTVFLRGFSCAGGDILRWFYRVLTDRTIVTTV